MELSLLNTIITCSYGLITATFIEAEGNQDCKHSMLADRSSSKDTCMSPYVPCTPCNDIVHIRMLLLYFQYRHKRTSSLQATATRPETHQICNVVTIHGHTLLFVRAQKDIEDEGI